LKVFIDSNVLISAARNPNGKPFLAFCKAVTFPNNGIICEQNIDEICRIFKQKFPTQIHLLENFLKDTLPFLKVAAIPKDKFHEEDKIRDLADRLILRAAVSAGAEILITGDKDFLEADVKTLKIMTINDFLNIFTEP
jgi:uncharacterized protein